MGKASGFLAFVWRCGAKLRAFGGGDDSAGFLHLFARCRVRLCPPGLGEAPSVGYHAFVFFLVGGRSKRAGLLAS